ncbi:hypothetical protein BJX66DRAFT_333680 [Aspergillus keveii]|uniref:Beta-glucuronidase C-terminal domain-containing protein n=1 Tax=Aspergillus keveii TaxID=714993 RepID=A0ABR4GKF8_9EURO
MAAGLINKTNIHSQLDEFNSALVTAQEAGIEFVLGETGSFSGHGPVWSFVPIDHVGVDIETFDPDAIAYVMPPTMGISWLQMRLENRFVSEVTTDLPTLAAYQVWENHQLVRLVLINSEQWAGGHSHNRPQLSIRLPVLTSRKRLRYKSLDVDSILATEGLTWGGESWETCTGRPRGRESFKKADARGVVILDASSVAVVYLGH